MKARSFYIVLCVIGLILPYTQLVPFVAENGFDIQLLFQQLFVNRISIFFGYDVLISAIVLIAFIYYEGKHLEMNNLWIPTTGTIIVGVSFGLPLFLFMREVHKEGKSLIA